MSMIQHEDRREGKWLHSEMESGLPCQLSWMLLFCRTESSSAQRRRKSWRIDVRSQRINFRDAKMPATAC